jgi:hypothetical protein
MRSLGLRADDQMTGSATITNMRSMILRTSPPIALSASRA